MTDIAHLGVEGRVRLAHDPFITQHEVRLLAGDYNDEVRGAIAEVGDLPFDLMLTLAVDRSAYVRACLAQRCRRLPLEVQELLSADPAWGVREALAGRRDLEPYLIRRLSRDRWAAVREMVAKRRDLRPDTRRRLESDECPAVREAAAGSGPWRE